MATYKQHRAALAREIGQAVRAGHDLGDLLSHSLGDAATLLGGVEALTAKRPASWESELVERLTCTLQDIEE